MQLKFRTTSDRRRRVPWAVLLLLVVSMVPQGAWGQICLDYSGYMRELGEVSSNQGYSNEGHLAHSDDTLFTVRGGTLYAFDVSVPGEYESLWELGLSDGWAEDMALQGDHLFVVADDSLLVVRYQGTSAPTQVAGLYHGGRAKKIVINGNYAYLSCEGYYDGGIQVVEISDPENPQLGTPFATDYEFDHMDRDGQLLYAQSDGYAMFAFSLADPAAPVEVSRNLDSRLAGAFDVTDSKAVLVYGDTLRVMDVSNPVLPVVVGALPFETGSFYDGVSDVTVDGVMVFVLDPEGA